MESLERFWSIVVEVWDYGILGISLGRVLVAVGIFLLFLASRRLFIWLVSSRLKALARRSKSEVDDAAVGALEQPIGLIPVTLGFFLAAEFLQLSGLWATISLNIVKSLIIVIIFWSFYRLVDPLSFLLGRLRRVFNPAMVNWMIKATKVAFVFVGAAAILQTWGIEVAPLLAGLGIFGVAVALGAQDVFKNLIAGLLVIAEKRFNEGDWIHVDGVVEGTVEDIGFRSTRIRRFDMAPIQVPNAKLSDEAVTNFSRMIYRRIYWRVGVEYRTTVDQLRVIRDQIEDYVTGTDEFVDASVAPTFVRIDRFSDSSIDILLYCFTRSTKWGDWLAAKEALAYRIKEIVEDAGTAFAFPSRSLYLESMPTEQPETFVPPEGKRGKQAEPVGG